jgi:integrase
MPAFFKNTEAALDKRDKSWLVQPCPVDLRRTQLSKNACERECEKAGIKVDERKKGDEVKIKFASAHDLRRSFGLRWARVLMPNDLMVLMRHETIETTMKFYVGQNAQETAELLWKVVGNTSGNSDKSPKRRSRKKQAK